MTARGQSRFHLPTASVLHLPEDERRVTSAAEVIAGSDLATPRAAVILGSGLGSFADEVEVSKTLGYDEIPGFPTSTALGHPGRLLVGSWSGTPTIMLQGRTHLYEGYSVSEVTFPLRVLHALGVQRLVLTNAAGGLNPRFSVGDLVVIDDHIDFTGARFAMGGWNARLRWNQNPCLYERAFIEEVLATSRREGFVAHCGTYVAVTGPNYETRAEYRMFRTLGGDVIGMSTVPEALVAAALGFQVLALSTVTNRCNPDRLEGSDGCNVVRAAAHAVWKMRAAVRGIVVQRDDAENGD